MDKKKSLKYNVVLNMLYQVVVLVFPLITSPYIARVLGATQIGNYSYVNTIANYFVLFAMLGLNNYGNRSIAQVRDDKKQMNQVFSEIFGLQLCSTLIVTCAYLIFVCFVKEYRILYLIQILHVISAGFDINWFCCGTENFKISLTRNMIVRVLMIILLFFFVKDQDDLIIYTLIMCLVYLLSAILLWPLAFKKLKFCKPSLRGIISHVKPNLILFVPVIAVSLYKYMDKIMLGMLCEKSEVGFYTYADQIIAIPESFVLAIGTVMMPRMSNIVAKGEDNKRLFNYSLEISMLLASAFAFGLSATGYNFALTFYGQQFARCGIFIQILSPVIMFVTWSSTFRTQFIIPKGRDYIYIVTVLSGAIVNFGVNFILIPRYQGIGAIIATLMAEIIVCIIQFLFIHKEMEYQIYIRKWISFAIMGGLMWAIVYRFQGITNFSVLIELIIQVFVGIVVYGVLAFAYYWFIRKDMSVINQFLSILHIKEIQRTK